MSLRRIRTINPKGKKRKGKTPYIDARLYYLSVFNLLVQVNDGVSIRKSLSQLRKCPET